MDFYNYIYLTEKTKKNLINLNYSIFFPLERWHSNHFLYYKCSTISWIWSSSSFAVEEVSVMYNERGEFIGLEVNVILVIDVSAWGAVVAQ